MIVFDNSRFEYKDYRIIFKYRASWLQSLGELSWSKITWNLSFMLGKLSLGQWSLG